MKRTSIGMAILAALALGAGPPVPAASPDAATRSAPGAWAPQVVRREIEPGMVAAWTDDHRLYLEAMPQAGEGLLAFSRRLTGSESAAAAIAEANGGLDRLGAGVRYRVPYDRLEEALRVRVLRTLFAADQARHDGWLHRVQGIGLLRRESLWHLAEWFTGDGANFGALRDANRLREEELTAGQTVLIPASLLLPILQASLPAAPPAATNGARGAIYGTPQPESTNGSSVTLASAADRAGPYRLTYDGDPQGDYAVYRLRAGEALYSSVVVRFTGRLFAADVNALAERVAQRSGIADVTDIPVGYAVKIPLELLLPEYLPADHPRRREYEAARQASARFGNQVRSRDLAGITVILDAGHGGKDVGASFAGVWESLYVYDIMLRVEHLLETYTAARVLTTTRDGERVVPEDREVLSFSRGHRVLTSPPYPIEESTVGVNLRWYLANSHFRQAVAGGSEEEKVVFLSLHADSLHPSLRGAMAYIPDAALRKGTFGRSGATYASRREFRERPQVSFSWRDRVKSEGLSRDLAADLIEAFRQRGLPVHPDKPVREKIIRRRSQYVPAVLRYNAVPAKVLLEVCNLANAEDRRLLQTRSHRQQMAEAVVHGLLSYYGFGGPQLDLKVAETR